MLDCTQNLTWPRYSNIINLYIKFHCKRCSLCEGNEKKLQIIGIFQSLMISITLSKVAQSNQKSNFQTWIMKDCPKIWFRSSDQISGGSSRLSRISTKIRHINSKWIHWDHKCWIFLPVNMTDMLALFLICWHYFIKDPWHPMTSTSYDRESQHGDINALWYSLCCQTLVSISVVQFISVAQWVLLWPTNPQVLSWNTPELFPGVWRTLKSGFKWIFYNDSVNLLEWSFPRVAYI